MVGVTQWRSISELLDRIGWIKRSGFAVNGLNQLDPSLRFLVHPANEVSVRTSALLYTFCLQWKAFWMLNDFLCKVNIHIRPIEVTR